MKKDLISMLDVKDDLENIIDDAIEMKKGNYEQFMKDRTMAMIFEKSSTRTRVSFEVAMEKLGGHAIFLSKNDIQLGRGETIEDTAKVLSRYVDVIMYRAYSHENMKELAKHATVPVINGLDDEEHPCQVLADFMTIKEKKGRLEGLKLVYFGDGDNNMAHSLLLGCAIAGMKIKIVAPRRFWPKEYYVEKAKELGGEVEIEEISENAAKDADVVVTDTWVSMGDEAEKEERLRIFKGYTVDSNVMAKAKPDAIFMHCLPAYYGYEVTKEVAHGSQSVIFDEAENRLWAQMAVLKWLFG
ncbi:MAG: ornithine carbamoyltransferase [Thermoplasmata archaeon]|nr:MAG: ornithine carbamoyltransferase [Thermoplasmata archaeon]HDN96095.1 ornithine carbamoyltransferase [Thermoplasmatales archaeon]